MKVLLINGSPHEKGCTYTALSLIAGELKAQGIETEILHVGGQPVGGCIGCGGCRSGNGCVFGGVVNEAIEKAKTADAFVFGSPVHYASAAGNMASFMDRLAYAGGKYLAYKPAAVCCSARRAGTTSTLDQLVKYPQFFHMPLVNGSYWAMVHGSNPEQVLQDAEGCAVMQELGRNMAWLLRCIEAGKAAGIDHPQNPPPPHDQLYPLRQKICHALRVALRIFSGRIILNSKSGKSADFLDLVFSYSPSRENDFRAPERRWRSGAPFLWAILYNFSKHFLGNLPPGSFRALQNFRLSGTKGA